MTAREESNADATFGARPARAGLLRPPAGDSGAAEPPLRNRRAPKPRVQAPDHGEALFLITAPVTIGEVIVPISVKNFCSWVNGALAM